jgi:uncharacterized protein YwgA
MRSALLSHLSISQSRKAIKMAKLKDVIGYLCENYPYKDELSKARLTKMVYLADWKACVDDSRPMTDIMWRFNHYGPYVEDVVDAARSSNRFKVISENNMYGERKETVKLVNPSEWLSLDREDKAVLDHVIKTTQNLTWNAFIKLVYSTYPVMVSERHTTLDLEKLARQYKKVSAA